MPPFVYKKSTPKSAKTWMRKSLIYLLIPTAVLMPILLWSMGFMLVNEDEFKHHEWALVLEGQGHTLYRTEAATELYLAKKIDKMVISGGAIVPQYFKSEFYAKEVVKAGVPEEAIYQVGHYAQSTLEEAVQVMQFFRERKVDTVVLVTSAYHTARAKRILNQVSQGNPYFITPVIEDPEFNPNTWMFERHARAIFVLEWMKSINSWLESFKEVGISKNISWVQGLQYDIRFRKAVKGGDAVELDDNDSVEVNLAELTPDNRDLAQIQDSLMASLSSSKESLSSSSIDSTTNSSTSTQSTTTPSSSSSQSEQKPQAKKSSKSELSSQGSSSNAN